jgi:NAD(P)H-flavin reductase/hemoglobin-like flavoprotein
LDVARLRDSFAHVAVHGDELPLFFYSDLFLKHPEVRDMFPVSMAAQRGHLVDALVKIVSQVDSVDDLTAFLQGLGRDHRKFGVVAEHYDAVGASLLATLEHFSGPAWTPELAADWKAAYELIGSVMTEAASADEHVRPPWWRGRVVAHEPRSFDVSVLFVQPEPRMDYLPGQSVAIESPSRPRLWRYYSMANAPRQDGLLEFHIRLIDGGAVSMALTSRTVAGAELRLGPPVGVLTLSQPVSGRDLLLVAGSTGLAPLKAILDQVAMLPQPPKVHLFFGARTADGLYDLASLEKMAAQYTWLTITPAVSADPRFAGETGSLADVVARHGDWSEHDAYLAGPTKMVRDAAIRLASAGVEQDQIHIEDFGWSQP